MRFLLLLCSFLIVRNGASGQSLFVMECGMSTGGHPAKAIFLTRGDGGGYIRMASRDTLRHEQVMTTMEVVPEYQLEFPVGPHAGRPPARPRF